MHVLRDSKLVIKQIREINDFEQETKSNKHGYVL